jgi:hypothetical protein
MPGESRVEHTLGTIKHHTRIRVESRLDLRIIVRHAGFTSALRAAERPVIARRPAATVQHLTWLSAAVLTDRRGPQRCRGAELVQRAVSSRRRGQENAFESLNVLQAQRVSARHSGTDKPIAGGDSALIA